MPDGEYDRFDDSIRPYMFVPFIQVRLAGGTLHTTQQQRAAGWHSSSNHALVHTHGLVAMRRSCCRAFARMGRSQQAFWYRSSDVRPSLTP